jgi:hypothetical protein
MSVAMQYSCRIVPWQLWVAYVSVEVDSVIYWALHGSQTSIVLVCAVEALDSACPGVAYDGSPERAVTLMAVIKHVCLIIISYISLMMVGLMVISQILIFLSRQICLIMDQLRWSFNENMRMMRVWSMRP